MPAPRRSRRLAALALVVIAATTLASSCILQGSWSFLPPIIGDDVPIPEYYDVSGVSCATDDFCMTIAQYDSFFDDQPGTFRIWDGETWTTIEGPEPPGTAITEPGRVSCPTSTTCAAAYSYHVRPVGFVHTYAVWREGEGWLPVPMESPEVWDLPDFDCAPDGSCVFADMRVGTVAFDGTTFEVFPLSQQPTPDTQRLVCFGVGDCLGLSSFDLVHWDGQGWSVVGSGPPSTVTAPGAANWWDYDCTSSTNCLAVGSESTPEGERPIGARYDGHDWTLTPVPIEQGRLYQLSCASPYACLAGHGNVWAAWTGNQWFAVPAKPSGGFIRSLSCGGSHCLGVGGFYTGDRDDPYVVSYDWSSAPA